MSDQIAKAQHALLEAVKYVRDPVHGWDLAALFICLAIGWGVRRATHRLLTVGVQRLHLPLSAMDDLASRLALPAAIAMASGTGVAIVWALGLPTPLLQTTAALAGSLVAIQAVVYGLTRAVKPAPVLAASEQFVAWFMWAVLALLILGWLAPLTQALDTVSVTISGKRFSLLDAARNVLTVLAFVVAASYVARVIERRVMRAEPLSMGVKIGVAKTARFTLVILSVLVAFNILGVDLGGLTVFSGALGVGLGFGLQRIASNFVSGFILIGDRSIRPGDVITIGNRFGVVRELRARYVVVRDRDGVDTLIPNENLITTEVVNWSYADRTVRLKLPVQISYQDNPRRAIELMVAAARQIPRIETTPEPAGRVMGFGASGIDLELRVWITDPEDGINNVRSDVYLAVWDAFCEAGITIPFPQRDVHLHPHDALPPERR